MLISLKTIFAVAGTTVAVGGIVGTTLWQTGGFSGSRTQSTYSSFDQASFLGDKSENCTFIDASRSNVFNILSLQESKDYKAVKCKNTNSGGREIGNWSKWIGLFPKELFKNDDLEAEAEFILKTKTEFVEFVSHNNIKTTFVSDKFLNSSVSGMWGNDDQRISDHSIMTVKVDSREGKNNNIFLLFGKEDIT